MLETWETTALTIIASAPIFAAIFSVIILKEKPNLFTWVTILIALSGMVIISWGFLLSHPLLDIVPLLQLMLLK